MGLGFCIKASIQGEGIFRRKPTKKQVLANLEAALRKAVTDPLLREEMQVYREDAKMSVVLHPAAEPVEFTFDAKHNLVCNAKTNTAGPGYHAFLVELLERAASNCNFRWQCDQQGDYLDETGYWQQRDFHLLQGEMVHWLQVLSGALLEQDAQQHFQLCLDMNLVGKIAGNYFAAYPLGYLSRDWFERVKQADWVMVREFAQEFFPWWGQGMNANMWLKRSLVYAWCEIPWHAPANAHEKAIYRSASCCFRKARELDSSLIFPEDDLSELETFATQSFPSTLPPREQGIGFFRFANNWSLAGGWRINLPGYWYAEFDEENGHVFWFGPHTVRISTMAIKDKDGTPLAASAMIVPFISRKDPANGEIIKREKDDMVGVLQVTQRVDNGVACQTAQGCWAMDGLICVVTIISEDLTDRDWALDIWQKISR